MADVDVLHRAKRRLSGMFFVRTDDCSCNCDDIGAAASNQTIRHV
jgi:hypothetical protein